MIEARVDPAAADVDADVCLIGAGAAGIALAREFLASRVRVLLVESGGPQGPDPADLLNDGENVGPSHLGLSEGRARGLGGTTRLWAGQCIPFEPSDFEPRAWVPYSGWPIDRGVLDPYYARAAALFRVPPTSTTDEMYRRFGLRPPAVADAELGHVATTYTPVVHLGRAYAAAFRGDRTLRVLLRHTVTALHTNDARSLVTHASASGPGGAQLRIRASRFVLCAGGIENARLLLLSGLGNDRGLVGRFLQDHPNGRAAEVETGNPRPLQDCYGLLYERPYRYYPKLRLSRTVQQRERVLGCALMINGEFTGGIDAAKQVYRRVRVGQYDLATAGSALRLLGGLPQVAATVYRRYARGLSPASATGRLWVQTYAEQAPNPDSRVTLSDRRDPLGLPAARVDWRLTDLDRRTAAAAVAALQREFARLELGTLAPAPWLQREDPGWVDGVHDAYHQMGTTRMSDDPARGVVDRDCRVHGVANLFAAGNSVFPTGSYANPTLTLVALAIRLADHLKQQAGATG